MSRRRLPTPPKIGGAKWDRELAALGVDRPVVDEELHVALTVAGTDTVDPHAWDFRGEPAEVAAAWVLLHQRHPSYGALMYLRHVWYHAGEDLRAWIVRQFGAMLVHGPGPVADSGGYGLWVDYFETPSDAPEVFAGLVGQLPPTRWHRLLSAAGPVPWAVKHDVFEEAAGIPALHAALATGIAGSFYDIYGDVDAAAAAELLRRITVADDELYAALVEATTGPLRLRSGLAILVADPAWEHPGSFLLSATVSAGRWRWVPGSELVVDGTVHGRMVHWAFPFDGTLKHRVVGPHADSGTLHRVEAPPETAEILVDRELELWPPGLREYLAQRH